MVREFLARGFQRIHRSKLIGMGIRQLRLPTAVSSIELDFRPGDRIDHPRGETDGIGDQNCSAFGDWAHLERAT